MKIDMSAHAITMRLKKTSELRRLCIALGGNRLIDYTKWQRKLWQGQSVEEISRDAMKLRENEQT